MAATCTVPGQVPRAVPAKMPVSRVLQRIPVRAGDSTRCCFFTPGRACQVPARYPPGYDLLMRWRPWSWSVYPVLPLLAQSFMFCRSPKPGFSGACCPLSAFRFSACSSPSLTEVSRRNHGEIKARLVSRDGWGELCSTNSLGHPALERHEHPMALRAGSRMAAVLFLVFIWMLTDERLGRLALDPHQSRGSPE